MEIRFVKTEEAEEKFKYPEKPKKYPKRTKEEKLLFKQAYLETEYSWALSRYIGEWDWGFYCSHAPVSNIVGDLSAEYILDVLNNDYCFDFDYEPNEGDLLELEYNYKLPVEQRMPARPYIACWSTFIFRKDKWIFDRYYDVKLEMITSGIINIL